MATGQPEQLGDFREYTSASLADTTSWTNPGQADWVQVIGAGATVVVTEAGQSRTITTDAAEPGAVLAGCFKAFTSTTATRVRMGRGDPPALALPVTGVASGSTIADAGGFTSQTTVEDALQEIYQDLKTGKLLVPVRLFDGILADGTPLAAFADSATSDPGKALANSKAVGVRWNNAAAQIAVWAPPIEIPYEADVSVDAVLRILCSKTGATLADATTFTVTAFAQTIGQLHDADADFGGTSSAITGDATAKTVQQSTLTLAAANLAALAAPAGLSMSIKPTDGTLGTDDMILHTAVIEFKRKLRTS
jgi:hypothetical protein